MKNLKRLRLAAGISQRKFAELVGVSASMIVRYENGTVYPRCDIALRMSKLLKYTINDLME